MSSRSIFNRMEARVSNRNRFLFDHHSINFTIDRSIIEIWIPNLFCFCFSSSKWEIEKLGERRRKKVYPLVKLSCSICFTKKRYLSLNLAFFIKHRRNILVKIKRRKKKKWTDIDMFSTVSRTTPRPPWNNLLGRWKRGEAVRRGGIILD